jgi:hypothetical protein
MILSVLNIAIPLFPDHFLLYIDPGTGSIILQAIVAAVVGGLLFLKYGWHRVLRFFGLKKSDKNDPSAGQDDTE